MLVNSHNNVAGTKLVSPKAFVRALFAGGLLLTAAAGAQTPTGVRVDNHPTRTDVKFVKFYSDLLGFETTTRVFLPPNYDPEGAPLPSLYFLHGTNDIATLDQIKSPGNPIPNPGYPFGPGGNNVNVEGGGEFLDEPASNPTFLIVYPDLGGTFKWCGHCWWVDGRNGKGVAAESHLYRELIPVIGQTFNVRRDRNGRAVSGKSMGANGTLVQAFRHPDWWRFALAFSPTEADGNVSQPAQRHFGWQFYLVDQGYGDFATDEVNYENIEPFHLTQNAVGTGIEVLVDIGDGCVAPNSTDPACSRGPETDLAEFRFRTAKDIWTSLVTERGVDLTYVVRPGLHATGAGASYRRYFMDRVARMFATPAPAPSVFSYSTADITFAVWGWDFTVVRPNDEFLHLSGARTDGTAITLAGTGTVTVTTPPLCNPDGLRALATADGVEGDSTLPAEVLANKRLRFTVNLGLREPAVNQRRALVESGKFNFPRTRVRLAEVTPAAEGALVKSKKRTGSECL